MRIANFNAYYMDTRVLPAQHENKSRNNFQHVRTTGTSCMARW